jgi:hypothetical protein
MGTRRRRDGKHLRSPAPCPRLRSLPTRSSGPGCMPAYSESAAFLRVRSATERRGRAMMMISHRPWPRAGARARCAAWCIDHGVRSITPVERRPGLRAALGAIRQHGAGLFVVAKRDWIARDVVLAASIDRAVSVSGARVVSASGEGACPVTWSSAHRTMSTKVASNATWRPVSPRRLPLHVSHRRAAIKGLMIATVPTCHGSVMRTHAPQRGSQRMLTLRPILTSGRRPKCEDLACNR